MSLAIIYGAVVGTLGTASVASSCLIIKRRIGSPAARFG